MSLADRFIGKVDASSAGGCWLWIGARKTKRGVKTYGHLMDDNRKTVLAHRAAYEISRGVTLDAKVQVMHSCDNPQCVRPSHLSIGSNRANIIDAYDKGRRTYKGKVCARLTDELKGQIRSMRESGMKLRDVAQALGVSYGSVHSVVGGAR